MFLFRTEWNNAKDFSNQATVNGAFDSVPDGTATAHIQVMLMQPLNTLFLIRLFLFCCFMAEREYFTIFLVEAVKTINCCCL